MATVNKKFTIRKQLLTIKSLRRSQVKSREPYELGENVHKAFALKKQKEILEHLKKLGSPLNYI